MPRKHFLPPLKTLTGICCIFLALTIFLGGCLTALGICALAKIDARQKHGPTLGTLLLFTGPTVSAALVAFFLLLAGIDKRSQNTPEPTAVT
jgi:hypothetical protein